MNSAPPSTSRRSSQAPRWPARPLSSVVTGAGEMPDIGVGLGGLSGAAAPEAGDHGHSFEAAFVSELAADHQPLNVGRALIDRGDAHVAIDALDGEVVEIAVAAVDLDGRRADLFSHLRGEQLGHRCLLEAGAAFVAQARGVQHHQLGRLQRRCHVGQAEGDRLMLDDRLPKVRRCLA